MTRFPASPPSSDRPEVSVVLPFHEGAAWLARAVESVRSQQGVAWELLVVDDGSRESPAPILERFGDPRILSWRIAHAGKGAALNSGIRRARAPAVCFLDQDDIMLPGRLARQVEALARDPGLDGVYSDYERRFDDGRPIDRFVSRQVTPAEALRLTAAGRGPVTMQTLLLRKACIEKLGGFSEAPELCGLDDLEFFVRLFLIEARLRYVPGTVQAWVRHERNFSRSAAFHDARLHWLRCLKELAARHPVLRREQGAFAFHARTMRGIYCLEQRRPRRAVGEFFHAVRARPLRWDGYYLLLKAALLSLGTLPCRCKGPAAAPRGG